jgi:hypothetical protein
MFDRFGVAFRNHLSCQELRRFGLRAAVLGFHSVWLTESYDYRSIPPVAAATRVAFTSRWVSCRPTPGIPGWWRWKRTS